MAAANPVWNLCEEATCSVCLEYFKDPVITDCGHIFCKTCLAQCTSCPQCREPCQQRNIRPIRQLASIVEIAKKFSLQTVRGTEVLEEVCQQHQEPLKLFCEDDQILICVVCDKSKEHRQHKVIPKKEAFEEYKNKIWDHLKILKKERDDIFTYKQSVETEMRRLLENIETERTKIVTEFKQLRESLNKKEQDLLTQLQDLNKEIRNISNKKTARLSEKMSSVETDIKKMEEKHNQPENELLQRMNTAEEEEEAQGGKQNFGKHSLGSPFPYSQPPLQNVHNARSFQTQLSYYRSPSSSGPFGGTKPSSFGGEVEPAKDT
ncbi:zinc finger protein RFP-like [Anolis sagrei]|uniref:zinc finger protein RFP-like n=1 Tax=Anolis sagrei TaxID=38937 RepID=UPI003522B221